LMAIATAARRPDSGPHNSKSRLIKILAD